MLQYTIFKKLRNGNLKICLNRKLYRSLDKEERKEVRQMDWWDLNEYNFCNGWQDVNDHNRRFIGALTSSPIIADGCIDEETTKEEIENTNVWWFPNYAITDEKTEIFRKGYVIFTKA